MMDYLDELIERDCAESPSFSLAWNEVEARVSLAELRHRAGLTQQQVADRMGVRRERVAELERNPRRSSLGRVERYVAAVGGRLLVLPAGVPSKLVQSA